MSLSTADVEHIARLARLELSAEEKARFSEQLSAILEHIATLHKLDTTNVPPTASGLAPGSHLRPDERCPSLKAEVLLKNAPAVELGQFKIPPVFERDN